jgi:hypothetical protein
LVAGRSLPVVEPSAEAAALVEPEVSELAVPSPVQPHAVPALAVRPRGLHAAVVLL